MPKTQNCQWSDMLSDELSLWQNAIDDDPPSTLQNTGDPRGIFSGTRRRDRSVQTRAEWIANLSLLKGKRRASRTLKVGYNKVFGYYIEISRAPPDKAPESYIRKQTLVNAEKFITLK